MVAPVGVFPVFMVAPIGVFPVFMKVLMVLIATSVFALVLALVATSVLALVDTSLFAIIATGVAYELPMPGHRAAHATLFLFPFLVILAPTIRALMLIVL